MKMLLLDVKKNKVEVVDATTLEDFRKYINCEYIDIVRRKINGKYFHIICDDEALLFPERRPNLAAYGVDRNACIFGNILVAGGKIEDENVTPLTDEEVLFLLNNIQKVVIKDDKNTRTQKILCNVSY